MDFRLLSELPDNLAGKFILLRADLNVPVQKGDVTDYTRIDRLKPSINFLTSRNARVIVLSHFGRPKGQPNPEYSLSFLAPVLQERWSVSVAFSKDCCGELAKEGKSSMNDGDVLLLENTRFHKGETENNPDFSKKLSQLGDYFVNDAFSAAHRAHASTVGVTQFLPAYAGCLMEAELEALNKALENPVHPVTAVVGGAKISTKLELLETLITKVDNLILGGGMANTFLKAQGHEIGKSLCENDMLETAKSILEKCESQNCKLYLPVDVVAADGFEQNSPHDVYESNKIPQNRMVLDAGQKSLGIYKGVLDGSKTLVWNGPLGAFEVEPFDSGTNDLASYAGKLTNENGLISVAGGGDTVSALEKSGSASQFSYISTAGGAFLEWLEGKTLPGVQALKR
ncbi:MAG: phosphoglycerate kinase [Alphaproteobacteria bacterium]|nr:phosphoglycerate kinase [Alphaproteobacteria bacterium]